MKRINIVKLTLLFLVLGGSSSYAQSDVTSQYITNPGFEACEVVADNDQGVADVHTDYSTALGTDYTEQGWKLVAQATSANGGVVNYGKNIQYSKWSKAGDPGPAAGPAGTTGNKALCFAGNKSVVYQQAEPITLPAGTYTLTVHVYARNGGTTNVQDYYQVSNIRTGFMPEGKSADEDLIPAVKGTRNVNFKSNAWDTDVLTIELTEATTGRFQLSYGSSYFVMIDDLKLEYAGGVVTTALAKVVNKAQALNEELNSSDLSAAILSAQEFMADPTSQEDVEPQMETLYTAMSTALAATTVPVDITAAYVENASFETGESDPWEWGATSGTVSEPVNPESSPYIDGANIAYFASSGSNNITQTINHLPAGYYIAEAKLSNGKAKIVLGSTSTERQGGTGALFLRVFSPAKELSAGEVTIGFKGSVAYRCDDFRLFYAKDDASLTDLVLQHVKADAQSILADTQFDVITGKERTELAEAIEGTNGVTINTKLNAFFKSKEDYSDFEKAKTASEAYVPTAYPYADAAIRQEIEDVCATVAASATEAAQLAKQLDAACFDYYVSNFYCMGVEHTDYTDYILGANATETPTGWGVKNMTVRTDKNGWTNPKTEEVDKVVYGVSSDYYRNSANETSILKQTLKNLPVGKYVLSVTAMGSNNLPIRVFIIPNNVTDDAQLIGTITTIGTSGGGKYGYGWNDYAFEFTKTDTNDWALQLQCKPTANYQEWYVDNFRLYLLKETSTGIRTIESSSAASAGRVFYDLSGRKVVNPTKGLYIVDGKKVILK